MDCSPPGSSVHGISQARILEWVAISYSRGPSPPRDQTRVFCISCIDRWILYYRATWKTPHFIVVFPVTKSCPTLCDSMDSSLPGFSVLQYLPEFAQTHILWVSNAIQTSRPLWSPSPPALSLFQHQGLFTSGGQSIEVSASVFPMNIQGWFPFGLTGLILQSRGLSRVFSNTTIQKHQFLSAQLSLLSNSHIHTWLLEKP